MHSQELKMQLRDIKSHCKIYSHIVRCQVRNKIYSHIQELKPQLQGMKSYCKTLSHIVRYKVTVVTYSKDVIVRYKVAFTRNTADYMILRNIVTL